MIHVLYIWISWMQYSKWKCNAHRTKCTRCARKQTAVRDFCAQFSSLLFVNDCARVSLWGYITSTMYHNCTVCRAKTPRGIQNCRFHYILYLYLINVETSNENAQSIWSCRREAQSLSFFLFFLLSETQFFLQWIVKIAQFQFSNCLRLVFAAEKEI